MTTPAGWYPDQTGTLRWWDGGQWTSHVAPSAPVKRGPALWVSLTVLAVGFALIALGAGMGLPHPLSAINGPQMTAPGKATMELDEGPWVVFEQVGHTNRPGPVTFSRTSQPTFSWQDITASGPATPDVGPDTINENLTRGSSTYYGIGRLHVPAKGRYTLTIQADSGEPRQVVVARPLSYAFRNWQGLLVGVLGGLVAAVGVVLLIVGLTRRRRASPAR